MRAWNVGAEKTFLKIHKLPLQRSNVEGCEAIRDRIGIVVDSGDDFPTEGIEPQKFMRVKVEIPLRAPIMRGLCLEGDDGKTQWVPFKYERLSTFASLVVTSTAKNQTVIPKQSIDRNEE
ncbi:hypothetical protein Scep_012755 [Stephania cephalantha]|uniref:Uncharacterized protein n=1 Tax=Stephania cephalantha TaxID=152367 RepID=A0AAP0JG47_9MAGN